MNTRQVQIHLKRIGWNIAVDGSFGPSTRAAVKEFQRGYTFTNLLVDGYAGPRTQHALDNCVRRGGKCGEFFTFAELRSKGNGWIKVDRTLVRALDVARKKFGPIEVISGYRDPFHNKRVGGKPNSQHLYGNAVDLRFLRKNIHFTELAGLNVFSGIGYKGQTGVVLHADVRHVGPNTTNASTKKPALWVYA